MTEFENIVITNSDKIKEIKQAIDSGESAFKDVQPAKETKLPDNAAEVWRKQSFRIEEMAEAITKKEINDLAEQYGKEGELQ